MPDGRACCDDVVVRRDGGGWKIEIADDWQRPMWGGISSRGTGELCLGLGDTGELSLRAFVYNVSVQRCGKFNELIYLDAGTVARLTGELWTRSFIDCTVHCVDNVKSEAAESLTELGRVKVNVN